MNVILAGPDDDGLAAALESRGIETIRVTEVVTREALIGAGVADADVLVLTAMADATAIPVAKDENPDVRVVTYARDSLPEFARAQADLALDPRLFDPDIVAEELVDAT